MVNKQKLKNIFADKASFVLRKMLRDPTKHWVVRDFTQTPGISVGLAQAVLEALDKRGCAQRISKGPDSYTILANADMLIEDWLKNYSFEFNTIDTYYSEDKNILKKLIHFLSGKSYALTSHIAANLLTSFVKTEDIFIYLKSSQWDNDVLALRQNLGLKQLVKGGNIHLIRPYYKTSVFFNTQTIKGFTIVSSLQLYLDLYNFRPRGQEHAEYFKQLLAEKGKRLD